MNKHTNKQTSSSSTWMKERIYLFGWLSSLSYDFFVSVPSLESYVWQTNKHNMFGFRFVRFVLFFSFLFLIDPFDLGLSEKFLWKSSYQQRMIAFIYLFIFMFLENFFVFTEWPPLSHKERKKQTWILSHFFSKKYWICKWMDGWMDRWIATHTNLINFVLSCLIQG